MFQFKYSINLWSFDHIQMQKYIHFYIPKKCLNHHKCTSTLVITMIKRMTLTNGVDDGNGKLVLSYFLFK